MKESTKKGVGIFSYFFFWMTVFITGFFGFTSFPKNLYIGMEIFAFLISLVFGIVEKVTNEINERERPEKK